MFSYIFVAVIVIVMALLSVRALFNALEYEAEVRQDRAEVYLKKYHPHLYEGLKK